MAKYLLKRVLQAIGVVFCISLITFFVLNIVPGNPVEIMLGEFADQATIARVTHEMGLDQPIYIQYFSWLGNMLQGNFGTSYFQNKPVIDILTSSFLVTAKLAGIAYILAVVLGVVVGVVAAVNHGKWVDSVLMTISVFGISAPAFWIAIILQIVICLKFNLLPLSGIDSFKIEGRMKTALYVATVARTYRKAIDDYKESPELYKKNLPWYLDQISNCTYRQFTTGFFFGKPSDEAQIYDNNTYLKEYTYLGIVGEQNEEGLYRIEQRNKFSVGEEIEIMKPDGENLTVTVKRIVDEDGADMESAPHPKQVLYIDLGHPLEKYDILRRKE